MLETHHVYVVQVVDQVQKSDQCLSDSGVGGDVPLVDVEAKGSTVIKVVPFKIGEDEFVPGFSIVAVRTRKIVTLISNIYRSSLAFAVQ